MLKQNTRVRRRFPWSCAPDRTFFTAACTSSTGTGRLPRRTSSLPIRRSRSSTAMSSAVPPAGPSSKARYSSLAAMKGFASEQAGHPASTCLRSPCAQVISEELPSGIRCPAFLSRTTRFPPRGSIPGPNNCWRSIQSPTPLELITITATSLISSTSTGTASNWTTRRPRQTRWRCQQTTRSAIPIS